MRVTVFPGALKGAIPAIDSKSDAHRLLIAAALADGDTHVLMDTSSEDIEATARCLCALGARIERTEAGLHVMPIGTEEAGECLLDCGESGSTLRFLLPLLPALGRCGRMQARGRLSERPNAPLIRALRERGALIDAELPPMRVGGRLTPGEFALPGDVSSQYFTGLLMALPLLPAPSQVRVLGRLESAEYVALTMQALGLFGIRIQEGPQRYDVPAPQRYHSPGQVRVQKDWSNAAFFLSANALGGRVQLSGLDPDSRQADRAILPLLAQFAKGGERRIDASGAPDLVPILSVLGALCSGRTRIVGAARLRLKESDRLSAMRECLCNLGADVSEQPDGLTISGGTLRGGQVFGRNDHRVVMAMAIAATAAQGPVTIEGAQAVNKSYPGFFADFERLGGKIHVEHDRD